MAVKLLYYFIFAFAAIMAFLLYQDPYYIEDKINGKKDANVEAYDVVNYSINKDGISSIINSSHVLRYDTHDEFYKFDGVRKKENNYLENIKADKGTLVKNDLELVGHVKYKDTNGVKFESSKAQYNLQTKVFKANENFILENNSTITKGNSLVYQTNNGKIYAKNIRSITEVKEN